MATAKCTYILKHFFPTLTEEGRGFSHLSESPFINNTAREAEAHQFISKIDIMEKVARIVFKKLVKRYGVPANRNLDPVPRCGKFHYSVLFLSLAMFA